MHITHHGVFSLGCVYITHPRFNRGVYVISTLYTLIKFNKTTKHNTHSRDIFINQKILPLAKLINEQEGVLAYKVINGTYLLNAFLNHGDIRHQIQLRNVGDLRIPLYATTYSQLFFDIEPSIRGMAYQVSCAAHHNSVVSRINYDSCISLKHSFPIYRVSVYINIIIKLLSSRNEETMQYS